MMGTILIMLKREEKISQMGEYKPVDYLGMN